MQKIAYLLLPALLACLSGPGRATDLDAAIAAYHAGNVTQAAPALQALAHEGSAPAQYYLARLYYYPQYAMPQDYHAAAHWFRLAAEQGHAEAQYKLGGCYLSGRGVAADDGLAVHWLLLAAAQQHDEALNILGALFANGRGVGRNLTLAYALQQLAAERGNELAAENIAAKLPLMTAAEIASARQLAQDLAVDGQFMNILRPHLPQPAR